MTTHTGKHICVKCTNKCYYFGLIKDSYLELIDQNKVEVHFRKGEIICKQGSFSSNVIFLTDGSAKLYIEGDSERSLMIGVVLPYNFIGLPEVLGDNVYHFSAVALEDTIANLIKTESFMETIENCKEFSLEIIKYFGKNGCMLFDKFINITQKQLRGRLADALIYLTEEIYQNMEFNLTLNRKDIAELSNMSTENAIRLLSDFKKEDIIEIDNKKLKILNIHALRRISKIG